MTDAVSFPPHPFWDFSLALYAQPGVADASIALQDDYGLNVNVLLLSVWYATRFGILETATLRAALAAIDDWDLEVVQSLRAVRRYCSDPREFAVGRLDALVTGRVKASVQAAELDAEHVEQLILAFAVESSGRAVPHNSQALADAAANLRRYLIVMQVEPDERIDDQLHAILAAAFPDAAPGRAREALASAG